MGLHHEVRALGDDLAVARDHAREGPSAIFDVLESQLDRAPDQIHALFPFGNYATWRPPRRIAGGGRIEQTSSGALLRVCTRKI
jgi:hypothetical protein